MQQTHGMTDQEKALILSKMEELTGVFGCTVQGIPGDGLTVDCERGQAIIRYPDKNGFARGCFLALSALGKGESLHIKEQRHFDLVGPMVDMSRGGVMNVPAVRHLLVQCAALGLNMMQLYTEDTYEIPEYPRMGYLRGRYTAQELREMDDFADSLGIELIPCIQTLAHMGQFLQWQENAGMKDQPTILLIDEDQTYALIESEIRAVRACFRSKRIHIGMDEANSVGLGSYYRQHGATDRFSLLTRHLNRVVDLCRKYDFKPMMWSDMFFRLGSKQNEYYDLDAHVPESVIAQIPDVQMVYWDYTNTDPALYDAMLAEHQRMKPDTVFAGGIWTWSGFLPHIALTNASMRPALNACLHHDVRTVLACLWGDDGEETPYSLGVPMLPLFSEACWEGQLPTEQTVSALGEAVTGIPARAFEAFSLFYPNDRDNRNGKGFLYCDLLYPLCENDVPPSTVAQRCAMGEKLLAPHQHLLSCRYAGAVMRVSGHKAEIISALREKYLARDMEYLKKVSEEEIPQLLTEIEELTALHREMWMREFKRNGWENLALRYGAISGRLRDVQKTLRDFLSGAIDRIDELEEEPLPSWRKGNMQYYQVYVSPMFSL